jgi:hypothetical protein
MNFILRNCPGAQPAHEIRALYEGLNNTAAVLVFEFIKPAGVYLSP